MTQRPTGEYAVDRLANRPGIQLVSSTDGGVTWTKPTRISPPDVPAVFPWMVAGTPGRLAVGWYEGTFPVPLVAYNEWHVALALSTTADAAKPAFKESFVTKEPNHVGQICVVGAACLPGAQDRSLLDFFEVRAMPDGTPVLAFTGDNDVKQATVKVFAVAASGGTKLW